jgi:hypothetical protein
MKFFCNQQLLGFVCAKREFFQARDRGSVLAGVGIEERVHSTTTYHGGWIGAGSNVV